MEEYYLDTGFSMEEEPDLQVIFRKRLEIK